MNTVAEVENGDFNVTADISANNEIGRLSEGINHMVEKIRTLLTIEFENEEKKRKLEMEALTNQLTPHFLYHTINSIHWIARLNKVESIDKMTLALIKLLHAQSRGDKFVTLKEEIEILDNYFSIQNYRFPDKFQTEFILPPNLVETKILSMLLQPLCENAIFHGIQPLDRLGYIFIEVSSFNGYIKVTITDNGVGIKKDILQKLNGLNENPDERIEELSLDVNNFGLALKNIRERLKLHYGSRASLDFTNIDSGGAVVTLCYPEEIKSGFVNLLDPKK